MKKKFLALALAAAVMAPTTSAFASQTVGGVDSGIYDADVKVEGSVSKADGTAPAGKIEVELPLKTNFTVDKDGKFTGSNFTINNKGGESIKVTLASFMESDPSGGITIDKTLVNTGQTTDAAHVSNFTRDTVRLQLNSTIAGVSKTFDLDTAVADESLGANIAGGASAAIAITGLAGVKVDAASDADIKGASEEFTLRFKIQKA